MINFKKIKFQNFLATGNNFIEYELDKTNKTLIIGKNGNGKSILIDALCYGLYGRAHRNINKPQLVNSITNKDMLVEIEFSIGNKEYLVRRGMKPNIFEIYIDNEMIKQDSIVKDYQSILENQILKINFKSFIQIVIVGTGNHTPFMQLPSHSRREIIEDLLDLQVFSNMNTLLKEKVSNNKEDYRNNDNNIRLIQSNISMNKEHLKSLKEDLKQQKEDIKKQINSKTSDYKEKFKTLKTVEHDLNEKLKQKEKLDKKFLVRDKCHSYLLKIENSKLKIEKNISFYSDSCSCPTCKQDINEDFKNKSIKKYNTNIQKLEDEKKKVLDKIKEYDTITPEYDVIVSSISELKSLKNSLNIDLVALKSTINSLKNQSEDLSSKVKNIDTSKQEEFVLTLEQLKEEKRNLTEQKEILTIAGQLLKDGGIKTLIIKQYIPIINKVVNQYLSSMNFFVDFNLDENFNETIKSRNKDEFSYESFSQGEKARIDLAILFAWRNITKLRNTASTNLLIFDEIMDSSLDNDGFDDYMKILNTLNDTHVFVISHKTENISDKFDRIIKVEKNKGFSKMIEVESA